MKKTVHLFNVTVNPVEGLYALYPLTADQFQQQLHDAFFDEHTDFIHYIGYANTLAFIERFCHITLGNVSREQAELQDRDEYYVARLAYRVDPKQKIDPNRTLTVQDFEFFRGVYYENVNIL